jgi:uncharacterized PurR-regulated membrane protein YhhQ (DUF165 family)
MHSAAQRNAIPEANVRKTVANHGDSQSQTEGDSMTRRAGLVALILFIATVWVANWLVSHYGIVDVGFGLKAPAAVFSVGVAFTLRDFVHRSLGRWWVVAGIVIGAGLSFLIAPTFALASGVAFLVSEAADLTVYTPLSERTWLGAVLLSNTVGLLIDSWIFLTLAFGSLTFFAGQVVGKAWMTVLTIAVIAAVRGARALSTRHA